MKKDLFDYVCREVLDGARFSVDFKTRSLKVNGKYIVKDGVSEIEQSGRYVPENFLYHIEDFYEGYKHSVPSERSESRSRNYFKALPEKELSDEDMMYGRYREFCRAQLEVYILCCLLEGAKWDESWGKWFWQSQNDKDLVLLREWFEPVKAEGV